jgi:hypothetical protein
MVFKNHNFMNYDSAKLHYFNSWIPGSDALPFRDGLPKKSTDGIIILNKALRSIPLSITGELAFNLYPVSELSL